MPPTTEASHAANARRLTNNFFNNLVVQFPTLRAAIARLKGDWHEFMEEQSDECRDILRRSYGASEDR